MLAPHAVDIAVINSSLIVSHLPNHSTTFFSSSNQVVHWSAEIQTNVYAPMSDRLIDQASEFALSHLTPTSHSAKYS